VLKENFLNSRGIDITVEARISEDPVIFGGSL
jgi:hypothetical protein